MQANILLNCSKQTGSGPINKNPHSALCFTVGILLFTMILFHILANMVDCASGFTSVACLSEKQGGYNNNQ